MDDRRWKVGELAEATGLTVRALHHFDEIGLLCPTQRSGAGHRLYSDRDVRRLYRILALRDLGIPLNKIANVLDSEAGDLELAVREQLEQVDGRIASQQRLRRRLTALLNAAQTTQGPSLDQLIDVMEAMMQASYFTADQLARLKDRHREEGLTGWQQQWADLAEEVKTHISHGIDPADQTAQETAQRWSDLMTHMTGGDKGILSSMYAKLDGKGPEAATRGVISTDVWTYIKRALAVGFQR